MAQPDPAPESLLANARRLARLASKAFDDVNRTFLIEKMEEQYILAIETLDGKQRSLEAIETRAELEHSRAKSGRRPLHTAPLLAESSAFRKALDSLAASTEVGRYFNGSDDVDRVVAIAKKWMTKRERLVAAEDATRAATCMLWREHREEEAVLLYDEFTNIYMLDILTNISNGRSLYLLEQRSKIASQRLLLTGRRHEARQLLAIVSEALRTAAAPGSPSH